MCVSTPLVPAGRHPLAVRRVDRASVVLATPGGKPHRQHGDPRSRGLPSTSPVRQAVGSACSPRSLFTDGGPVGCSLNCNAGGAEGAADRRGELNEGAEMIVVVGRVSTDAERRDELLRVGQAVAAASRAEQGCISYRLYEDSEIENDFVFVEEWEDD